VERVDHEGARDLDEHALSARELARLGMAHAVQGHEVEELTSLLADLRQGPLASPVEGGEGGEQHVLEHRHVAEELGDLEGPRHSARRDLVGAKAIGSLATQMDLAPVGTVEAGEHVDGGGLA
jgi:hypothetical protein